MIKLKLMFLYVTLTSKLESF